MAVVVVVDGVEDDTPGGGCCDAGRSHSNASSDSTSHSDSNRVTVVAH